MAMCVNPIFVDNINGVTGCGQCKICRTNLRRKKTSRILMESLSHSHRLFVTLTYSDRFLPLETYHPSTGEFFSHPQGTLCLRSVQLFLKRLRKKLPPKTLRYFYCGEYGEKTFRPHYHFILFGLPYSQRSLIYESWHDPDTGVLMCDPNRIDVQVPRSDAHCAQYVSSYILKKMTSTKSQFQSDWLNGRMPEFAKGSQGLGRDFINNNLVPTFLTNNSAHFSLVVNENIPRSFLFLGKNYPIDRYTKEKILNALPSDLSQKIVENTRKNYEEEMSSLLSRALDNPQIFPTWKENLNSSNPKTSAKYLRWLLEKQFELENESASHSVLRKMDFFNQRKGVI